MFKKINKNSKFFISFNDLIDAYTGNEDLRKELKEYLRVRKLKRAVLTNRALELLFERLDKLANSEEEKILIVKKTIMNGWTSFFELNNSEKKINNKSNKNL